MTEKEWRRFNDILLEIYYAGSLETFGERCLKLIRILIPYTQGYFLVIDEDGRLDVAHSVFENVDPVMKRKYLDTYFAKDYLMQMCNFTKSMAYRDTDLLTDEKRRASVIYREYFKPQKLDMGYFYFINIFFKMKKTAEKIRYTFKCKFVFFIFYSCFTYIFRCQIFGYDSNRQGKKYSNNYRQ